MKTKEKKFDAVKMMRDIRNKLHEEYESNPDQRKVDMERIRKNFKKMPANK
jgi:hypothetical protein